MPHGHRAHLHGCRGARGRRARGRSRDPGRVPGGRRGRPGLPGRHRRGRRRHLRRRRRGAGQAPVRRQAHRRGRRQGRDQRPGRPAARGREGRCGPPRRRRPADGDHGDHAGRGAPAPRWLLGGLEGPSVADDRGQLHDPVRRRRRDHDRPGLHARPPCGRGGRRRHRHGHPRDRPHRQLRPHLGHAVGRAPLPGWRGGVRLPGRRARRLHRLRHRRPSRARTRLRRRCALRRGRGGLPRGARRRVPGRLPRAGHLAGAGAAGRGQPDAGRGHAAAGHHRHHGDHAARRGSTAGQRADRSDRRPEQPLRRLDRRARRGARTDDGLRHGRARQQDRLRLRHRRADRLRDRRRQCRPHRDGRGHGRRHDAAARAGAGHGGPPPALHRRRTREREGGLAPGGLLHHRGCDPLRRRRPAAGDPLDHGRVRSHRCPGGALWQRARRPARRHLGDAVDQRHPGLPPGDRRRDRGHRGPGHRRQVGASLAGGRDRGVRRRRAGRLTAAHLVTQGPGSDADPGPCVSRLRVYPQVGGLGQD
ncbi:hypothetical protein NOCARDAX2BIS_400098 [Nocardioides sp. AX2bis]|nr:hypothetical protein NOCARDAX2BIS_400098 [Nocardioides sp. AX2bis]